jgi:hypothetical protein
MNGTRATRRSVIATHCTSLDFVEVDRSLTYTLVAKEEEEDGRTDRREGGGGGREEGEGKIGREGGKGRRKGGEAAQFNSQ